MVVVVGASAAGKSRSLFEAVREVCPGWQVLLADSAAAVRRARLRLDPHLQSCTAARKRVAIS
jgi:hypothetical protein